MGQQRWMGGGRACVCNTGWTGSACDKCASGWTGPACDKCSESYFKQSGACCPGKIKVDGFWEPCSGNGSCNNDGTCECGNGFDGTKCDKCATGYTSYTGGCIDFAFGYYGSGGYNSSGCQKCSGYTTGDTEVCSGNGSCNQLTYGCECNVGYTGDDCSSKN